MAIATTTNTGATGRGKVESKGAVLWALRAALVLTTSYVASAHMDTSGAPRVGIGIDLASVDSDSIEFVVEGSRDASTWFQIDITEVAVTLANTLSATDAKLGYTYDVSAWLHVRVKVKRTAGTASGTCAITATAGTGT